ncbi:MAG: bifunctional UDP-N-acetylglucosamine diphosphorylase/glucosamine-1-phosphate N-acetyltransferase GlmU, partial [Thermomicrobiales bacterium]
MVAESQPAAGLSVIILAAGAGTRMKSDLPKPLHSVAGRTMLEHVLAAVEVLSPAEVVVVASPDLESRPESDALRARAHFVIQDPPRGTGDAMLTGLGHTSNASAVMVVYADHPLVSPEDLVRLHQHWVARQPRVALLTCVVEDAAGYGRIERDDRGVPRAIVERVADDAGRRTGQTEINSGIQILDAAWARTTLLSLPPNPVSGEIFLTDLVAAAYRESDSGTPVLAVEGSKETLLGVNDRAELATVDAIMRRRIRDSVMRSGVTIVGPETVFIDAGVKVGRGSTILPFTMLTAATEIGEAAIIGPHATIHASSIGDRTHVEASFVGHSRVGDDCHIGPWSHLRSGVTVERGVHVGNFVEIKNSHLSAGVRAGHVSYLGDASIGENTIIGAGTVTCNFDGVAKHRTTIGAN